MGRRKVLGGWLCIPGILLAFSCNFDPPDKMRVQGQAGASGVIDAPFNFGDYLSVSELQNRMGEGNPNISVYDYRGDPSSSTQTYLVRYKVDPLFNPLDPANFQLNPTPLDGYDIGIDLPVFSVSSPVPATVTGNMLDTGSISIAATLTAPAVIGEGFLEVTPSGGLDLSGVLLSVQGQSSFVPGTRSGGTWRYPLAGKTLQDGGSIRLYGSATPGVYSLALVLDIKTFAQVTLNGPYTSGVTKSSSTPFTKPPAVDKIWFKNQPPDTYRIGYILRISPEADGLQLEYYSSALDIAFGSTTVNPSRSDCANGVGVYSRNQQVTDSSIDLNVKVSAPGAVTLYNVPADPADVTIKIDLSMVFDWGQADVYIDNLVSQWHGEVPGNTYFNLKSITDSLGKAIDIGDIEYEGIKVFFFINAPVFDPVFNRQDMPFQITPTNAGADLTGPQTIRRINPQNNLPGFSGQRCLQLLKAQYEEIPFDDVFNAKPEQLRLAYKAGGAVAPTGTERLTNPSSAPVVIQPDVIIYLPFKMRVKESGQSGFAKLDLKNLLPDDPTKDILGRSAIGDDLDTYINMARSIVVSVAYLNTMGISGGIPVLKTSIRYIQMEPLVYGSSVTVPQLLHALDLLFPFRPELTILLPATEQGQGYKFGYLDIKQAPDGLPWGIKAKLGLTIVADLDKVFNF